MPRILVIDDSPSTLEAIAAMLDGAGHQVRSCANGNQALELLGHEAFDLILTDIFMPDGDGIQLIMAARRLCPSVPIVAMSGGSGSLDMLRVAKHLGACRLLRKPFSSTDLLAVLDLVLHPAPMRKVAPRP